MLPAHKKIINMSNITEVGKVDNVVDVEEKNYIL